LREVSQHIWINAIQKVHQRVYEEFKKTWENEIIDINEIGRIRTSS